MPGRLEKAFGYQDDNMALPVADLAAAIPFYENVLGFEVISRGAAPFASTVLARDEVQIGLVQNGADASQDGCAFHVKDLGALLSEFHANGLNKDAAIDVEEMDGEEWNVFYVVAPDGLCYWFGERKG